ncbi:hypothetical protein ACJIZ3_000698 [Penstemon smallii]|uniref:Uncharacterized protein n=1 Tax=Penstemon smallii TaxID=265156 RepID=A0ABD3RSE1_9LAMI
MLANIMCNLLCGLGCNCLHCSFYINLLCNIR